MKFFLDTAIVDEIKKAHEWGLLDGVTTNPSLVAKTGKKFRDVIKEICAVTDGPVSAEVLATTTDEMVKEAKILADIAPNVVVKIPFTPDGVRAVQLLSSLGIPTNVTLIFSSNQALLAAKAGASYVSPFVGRLDDINHDGMALVEEILNIYDNYGFTTEVLVASIRNPIHVKRAALMGAHVSTMPFSVLKQLFSHPLTDNGLDRFLKDWKESKLEW
ncbi:MAG TPA: fructose-6-phosphate aldolase [Thermoanaerobaculia bacterium]|nr:fructose-6-phosphate aldolase [Thermoanaerobaculia bacterium]HUM30406.1 fructose-6-phosphate aldolase [Thermoanaerobaculia bacterium]HXK68583.1 fructose-6-phosphate aldolase [Thermoanaerobaculia bacterium]